MRTVAVLAAALMWVVIGAAPASAADREVITGSVLKLVSVQYPEQMRGMAPGEVATWNVRVSASEPEGEIAVALSATEASGEDFRVDVQACRNQDADCATVLRPTTLAPGATVPLAQQDSADAIWYRISVEALQGAPNARTLLTLSARGHGEEISTADEQEDLPGTGASGVVFIAVVALAVVALGVVLWLVSKRGAR